MTIKNLIKGLQLVLGNYQKLIKKSFLFLLYIIVIIGVSFLITFPIWFAATKYSKIYSFLIIFVLLILLVLSFVKKLNKWVILKKDSGISTVKIFLIPVKRLSVFFIFLILFYLILFLFSKSLLVLPIILSLGYLLALGSYIFIYRKKNAHIFS